MKNFDKKYRPEAACKYFYNQLGVKLPCKIKQKGHLSFLDIDNIWEYNQKYSNFVDKFMNGGA